MAHVAYALGSIDPMFHSQFHLHYLNVMAAWERNLSGQGVGTRLCRMRIELVMPVPMVGSRVDRHQHCG
jgi:hypothetical protein